jgi:cytochrome c oxidase subunit 4
MSDTHHHYVTPLPVLLATFVALVLLTLLTVFQATQTYVDLGRFEIGITLAIATAKAALVALIFMQLAHDKPMNGVILISALLFVGLFLSFVLMDSREYEPQVEDFLLNNPKTADNP